MSKIIPIASIKKCIQSSEDESLIDLIENGFVQYSNGKVNVAPVGYLPFESPPGDLHIKYGYIRGDDYYVIKMASGFYENPKIGLNSSNGLMLVFSQKTGELLSILLDEGYLTDVRTALAGAVVARHLAPKNINAIGIIGTGIQARLQLRYLRSVVAYRDVWVWGRSKEKAEAYCKDELLSEYKINVANSVKELASHCNLIITTTPSKEPLLFDSDVKGNVHITAVGADAPGKQEIDSKIFSRATTVVVDSMAQCTDHGEVFHPLAEKIIAPENLIELGTYISTNEIRKENSLTVADLTGVAVQDIQIAKYLHQVLS